MKTYGTFSPTLDQHGQSGIKKLKLVVIYHINRPLGSDAISTIYSATRFFLESKNLYNLLDLLDQEIIYLQEE